MSLTPATLSLPQGVTWNYSPTPKFSTILQVPQSGRHPAAATLQDSAIFDIDLSFDYLTEYGYQYLKSFFEAQRGAFGWFLFDPSVNNLASMTLTSDVTQLNNGFSAIAAAGQTVFPLWRSSAVFNSLTVTLLERIQNVTSLAGVYVNGTLASPSSYTLGNLPAAITFNTAPGAGAVITWAGSYSYLCHFSEDTAEFSQFLYQLYKLRTIKLETIDL